jgi:hypothetical protein
LQNDSALYQAVAIKLKPSLNGALIDQCGEAETCRLRCGKIVHGAFCQPQLRNPGSIEPTVPRQQLLIALGSIECFIWEWQ